MRKMAERFDQQKNGHTAHQQGLPQRGESLDFAVTVAVIFIGRPR